MKYIKLFEKFTKEYQNKIDLKDFKKIKKGSMIQYMGGAVEVVDNNGYVLKLKDDDGKIFTVNKSQFANFFLHISSSWVKIRLHTENQPPRLSRSALKVYMWWWWWVVVQLTTLSLST